MKTGESYKTVNMRIGPQKHQLQTIKANKVHLSIFDDKRYVLEDSISTLPLRHYITRGVHVEQDIVDQPEWGNEQEELPSSPTCNRLDGNDSQVTITQIFPDEASILANDPLSSPLRVRVGEDETISMNQEKTNSVTWTNLLRNLCIDDEAVEASDTNKTALEDDE